MCGTAQTMPDRRANLSGRLGLGVRHHEVDRMNSKPVMGISRVGMVPDAGPAYPRGAVQPVAVTTAAAQLQQARAQVEELQQALSSSQQESMTARQQVALLTEANARLRELVAKGEKEVTKARHFAYHDELTGLPNRTLLLDRLNQALIRAKRKDSQVALLVLDLDGFKDINDRMGHAAGDKLLQRVANASYRVFEEATRRVATVATSLFCCWPRSMAGNARWRWRRRSASGWPNPIRSTTIRLR